MKAVTIDERQTTEQTGGEQSPKNPQIINGVNVDEFNAAVEAIKEQAEIPKRRLLASNKWVNGGSPLTTVNNFYAASGKSRRKKPLKVKIDNAPLLFGNHRSANPVESALAALASCLTTTLIYHAALQGIKIESVEASFEGDTDLRGFLGLDETVRRGLDSIRVSFKIKSDASEEKIQELIELAQKRSSVFDMLRNGVPISVQLA
jgi:uncharacterized OsmC-like protein